jgi:LmbE family N-acetylglucosaminyl deacetylase
MLAADQALFIFAHQDDEVAAAPRILFELGRGATVLCAFLTDGSLGRADAGTRDRESLRALRALGVDPANVAFIGSREPIRDSTLMLHLDLALRRLEEWLSGRSVSSVYCLAWEGGHPDHDASHLVAVALAARRGLLDRCFELPLYRGAGATLTFRVLAPLPPAASWTRRRVPLREALRSLLLVPLYRSQWRSLVGLLPELVLKVLLLRREVLRPVDIARIRVRPHRSQLLYERWFGVGHEQFTHATAAFVDAHLSSARDPSFSDRSRPGETAQDSTASALHAGGRRPR